MLTYTCYSKEHDCNGSVNSDVACGCECHVPKPKPRALIVHQQEPTFHTTGDMELVLVSKYIIDNEDGDYDWDERLFAAAQLRSFNVAWAQKYAQKIETQVKSEKYQMENGEEFPDDI